MAELVDALASGASELTLVRVRVSLPPHDKRGGINTPN